MSAVYARLTPPKPFWNPNLLKNKFLPGVHKFRAPLWSLLHEGFLCAGPIWAPARYTKTPTTPPPTIILHTIMSWQRWRVCPQHYLIIILNVYSLIVRRGIFNPA